MNKRELSQLNKLQTEIEELKKKLKNPEFLVEPKITTDSVKGSMPEYPYVEHTIKIEGIDYSGYNRAVNKIKKQLQEKLDELEKVLESMFDYIYSLPDSEMRQILTLRYIDGLTWQEVAERMGCQGDGSTQRKRHDKFMKFS
jgi:DNA-directed RNA polymerase specialized sigma subunit